MIVLRLSEVWHFGIFVVCSECDTKEATENCWYKSLEFHGEMLQKSLLSYATSLGRMAQWRNGSAASSMKDTVDKAFNASFVRAVGNSSGSAVLSRGTIRDVFLRLLDEVRNSAGNFGNF